MDISALLGDSFGRVEEEVHGVLDGIDEAHLTYQPDPEANTVAWLIWHLTRVQDDHLAAVAAAGQRWTAAGFFGRFGLPFDESVTGWGQSPQEVRAVRASAALLGEYFDDVHRATSGYLEALAEGDLDRIVDERWDPPVTLGVRLVSVLSDNLQHVGQAAYLRGLAERAG